MKKYTENAPYGVTVLRLDNGDEALYLHGECLACADKGQCDDPVTGTGERLAETLGVPFRLLTLRVPDDEAWSWNDVVHGMGWGKTVTLGSMMIRPVMECSTAHITPADNALLADLSLEKHEGEWIMYTGTGYLIRLDARIYPVLHLKRFGLSAPVRWLIYTCMKQADISMIYFSQMGCVLDGFTTFDW